MPSVHLFGHFAVIVSITEASRLTYKAGRHPYGWRRMALMQIDPSMTPPSRIDPRIKSIKKIILISDDFGFYSNKGWWAFQTEFERYKTMAEKFNQLYPFHIMAKEWPLPLPVYVD